MKIEKSQLNILKSYINPPGLVVLVLSACCLLFNYEETWESAKRYLLNDMRFIEKLIDFNVKSVTEARFEQLRKKYINNTDFNRDLVIKQSQAAGSIFFWIIAIDKFQRVIYKPRSP